jgi:hypothetical protein
MEHTQASIGGVHGQLEAGEQRNDACRGAACGEMAPSASNAASREQGLGSALKAMHAQCRGACTGCTLRNRRGGDTGEHVSISKEWVFSLRRKVIGTTL